MRKTATPRKRQTELPGMEQVKCPAVEKAARKFLDCRDDRFGIIKEFADAKLNLVSAMRENKIKVYEFDGYVLNLNDSQEVKAKKKKAESSDE